MATFITGRWGKKRGFFFLFFSYEPADKVVFCRGFIYETCFNKGSDKSDRYNIGVFQQPPISFLMENI